MALEIDGKLVKVLPLQTGEGKNGTWSRQDFVIEVQGQYPYNVCFTLWGDKIDIKQFAIGDFIRVAFDVNSREFQEKWFTALRPWKVEKLGQAQTQPQQTQVQQTQEQQLQDDLPF